MGETCRNIVNSSVYNYNSNIIYFHMYDNWIEISTCKILILQVLFFNEYLYLNSNAISRFQVYNQRFDICLPKNSHVQRINDDYEEDPILEGSKLQQDLKASLTRLSWAHHLS